jgi:hypothetical protein
MNSATQPFNKWQVSDGLYTVGSRIAIQPQNLSPRRQYLANATGEITAIKGNKASVLLDGSNKRRTIKIDLCSLRLISAQGWGQDSHMQESLLEDSSYGDFAKLTSFAVNDSAIASPVSEFIPTCENSGLDQEQQTSSQLPHHASHSQLKEDVWEALTQEIVSEQFCDKSDSSSPSSLFSKTCLDCYQPPLFPETNPAHILGRCSGSFMQVGTMHNGLLLEQPSTVLSGQEKGSCLLPRPGALSKSSESSRPPGNTKSEAAAKKLGILQKNEVYNPEWLEAQFGLPLGWTSPQEHRAATALLALEGQHSEIVSTPDLQQLPLEESCTSTPSSFKAISLWLPWASLIPLGLKHYETRSWKTNYRGKLLICSAVKSTKDQYQQYLKICNEVELPPWSDFLRGCAIAVCDLVDCVEMTAEFIGQQSQTEILCGDWQIGRYAWKLENIQPITEPFAVKGKQGLFNVSVDIFQSQKQLTDNSGDNQINPSNDNLLGDIESSPSKSPELSDFSPSNNPSKVNFSPSKRRQRGLGSGSIHWRTITKNGRDYPQAYYHWKENGNKRSKYIPKHLLGVIQEAEAAKRPVIEILELLGVAVSPSKLLGDTEVSPSNNQVLGDIEISPSNLENSPSKVDFSPSNDLSNNSGDIENSPSNNISPSKTRRHKGEGSGSIHWRTITKGGKDYPQAYYHYEFWNEGDRLTKSTKYIPKRLLAQVQQLEQDKAPVREILGVLGVVE